MFTTLWLDGGTVKKKAKKSKRSVVSRFIFYVDPLEHPMLVKAAKARRMSVSAAYRQAAREWVERWSVDGGHDTQLSISWGDDDADVG
jgi:hypothetical protein